MKTAKNIAYIDAANLHHARKNLHWDIDYRAFRIWLGEKYHVEIAYLFIGYIAEYEQLYVRLKKAGFELIFKDVVYDRNGKAKGNCDADLIVKAMQDAYENNFDKSVIVSSDGDYVSLVTFLLETNRLEAIVSPAPPQKCSVLLKRTGARIAYISDQRSILGKR